MRSAGLSGYPSFSTQNQGFFTRHMRRISSSLPRFSSNVPYAEKEKLGRGRWSIHNIPLLGRAKGILARMGRKMKIRMLICLILLFCVLLFYITRRSPLPNLSQKKTPPKKHPGPNSIPALHYYWRRTKWLGGGKKFVIILAANVGGGVMEWKGAREWAIERDSVRNKRKYVARWGYDIEIVDMSTKKRYAHEWRESWEKVDFIRSSLRKYPDAEW